MAIKCNDRNNNDNDDGDDDTVVVYIMRREEDQFLELALRHAYMGMKY